MNTNERAAQYKDYVVEMRRHFHMHPELSQEEYETTEFVAKELDKIGVSYERLTKTGLIATIQGKSSGKTVALRSDMDALNVTQKNDVSYKSLNEGKMHACGHDAHTAILLGAAHILNDMKDTFEGTVNLVFQPAEEVAAGAKELMAAGDWYSKVDNFFGAHVWSNLESGKVSVEAGQRMAAADLFKINVTGKSGHGSMPHQTVDSVVVASAIVLNLQTLVSREYSPLDALVVTVGSIHSGNRFNVIAGSAVLEGTVRYFTREIAGTIEDSMRRVVESTAAMYRCEATLEYSYVTPPLINEESSSAVAYEAALKTHGAENVVKLEKTTGGEDFAYYLKDKPGCFAFIGTKNVEKKTDVAHHNEYFDVDEDALIGGSALYAEYALTYLNQK
ncbi:MAG: amidohydrolase [Clostridiaceae bacterium]